MTEGAEKAGRLGYLGALIMALFIHAVFAMVAVLGALTIHAMVRAWRIGEATTGEALGIGAAGLLMLVIGLGFYYAAYVGAPRFLNRLARQREKYHHAPWLANPQWRARRMVHSTRYAAWFMWFWSLCWWGILGFLWSVNKDLIVADLRGSWGEAIPTAIPFVAGIIAVLIAINLTWQRRRYGDAVLVIDTLPGFLGDRFRGKVMARLNERPAEPVIVRLVCGSLRSRQERSPSGGIRTEWITDALWSDEHSLHPTQTTFDRGMVTIPIRFDLPEGLPECGDIEDDPQIVWTLSITPGSVLDRPLACKFDVPVYERRERSAAAR